METVKLPFEATTFVINQDRRNFHRPNYLKFNSTVPLDDNMTDDPARVENQVKLIQNFLKLSPLGVSYKGSVDGKPNVEMIESLKSLQTKIDNDPKLKDKKITVISGSSASIKGINEFMEATKDEKSSETINPKETLLQFQKLLGLSDEKNIKDLENKIITAAKSLEDQISSKLGPDASVKGYIVDPNTNKFKTSADDVAQTLELLKKKEQEKKDK